MFFIYFTMTIVNDIRLGNYYKSGFRNIAMIFSFKRQNGLTKSKKKTRINSKKITNNSNG